MCQNVTSLRNCIHVNTCICNNMWQYMGIAYMWIQSYMVTLNSAKNACVWHMHRYWHGTAIGNVHMWTCTCVAIWDQAQKMYLCEHMHMNVPQHLTMIGNCMCVNMQVMTCNHAQELQICEPMYMDSYMTNLENCTVWRYEYACTFVSLELACLWHVHIYVLTCDHFWNCIYEYAHICWYLNTLRTAHMWHAHMHWHMTKLGNCMCMVIHICA